MVYEAGADGGQKGNVAVLFKNTDWSCGRSIFALALISEYIRTRTVTQKPAKVTQGRFVISEKDRKYEKELCTAY